MADPTPKKIEAPDLPVAPVPVPETAVTAAQVQQQTVAAAKLENFKSARSGLPSAVLPGGRRIDASPYVNARYRSADQTMVLGAPESIIKEDFKRAHPGWRYMWPIAKAIRTQAYVNADRYQKVPYEAIDAKNHLAMVQRSPEGDTVWMQHVLVAVSPQVWAEEIDAPAEEAIGRTAMSRRSAEEELNRHFGHAGYKGEFTVGDHRQER